MSDPLDIARNVLALEIKGLEALKAGLGSDFAAAVALICSFDSRLWIPHPRHESRSTDRVQQLWLAALFQLFPQITQIHIKGVGISDKSLIIIHMHFHSPLTDGCKPNTQFFGMGDGLHKLACLFFIINDQN